MAEQVKPMPTLWPARSHAESRHTIYFSLLDALQEQGCPLCRLVLDGQAWYLDMLSHEGVNDPGLRAHLRSARGFCHHHAWQFTREVRNGAGRAMIYRDVVGALLRTLAGRGAAVESLLPAGECVVCRSVAAATQRYFEVLALHLGDAELRRRYEGSQGLCLPHLRQALRLARQPADVALLLEVAQRCAGGLRVASRTGLRPHTAAVVGAVAGRAGALWPHPQPLAHFDIASSVAPGATLPPGAGCPVCRAAAAAADACLLRLPATVHAAGPAPGPATALDLCTAHAWRALELHTPGAAARLWQPAARAARSFLAEATGAGPSPRPPGLLGRLRGRPGPGAAVAARLERREPCPVCHAQAIAELRAAQACLDGAAGVPCLPHAVLCLHIAGGRGGAALLRAQQAALQALRADLDEYIRKQDFYCREAPGREADSPWRAVAQVAGAGELAVGPLGWVRRPSGKG